MVEAARITDTSETVNSKLRNLNWGYETRAHTALPQVRRQPSAHRIYISSYSTSIFIPGYAAGACFVTEIECEQTTVTDYRGYGTTVVKFDRTLYNPLPDLIPYSGIRIVREPARAL